MVILAGSTSPQAKGATQSERETSCVAILLLIRAAIHRYKEAADQGAFQIKVGSEGYPPNLDTLVTGVATDSGKKLTFLRGIPVDPIAKQEWGVLSTKNTSSWGGPNVFDVFCKSDQVAVDGTKYKDW